MQKTKENLKKSVFSQAVFTSVMAAGICRLPAADLNSTNAAASNLADLSVEQLMNESVTSVAKRETKLNESAAAITVITQEDIRRLGITTIPDALRLVPGLEVAQINSHEWAVSARGFNVQFANKLLVLIDGRSVYGTGFGGVVWGVQDLVMEDIDRIEVIRGPGASLWGANAMNGVINIITKSAKDTQGGLVSVSGGTFDQPSTSFRYGGTLATNLYFRVYGKYSNRDGLQTTTGQDAPDRALNGQGGMRLDWEASDADKLTLQGDYYRDRFDENQSIPSLLPPYSHNSNASDYNSGGNVLGRWTHDFSSTSSLTLQTYYDHLKQEQVNALEKVDTFDFDAQHRFALGTRNEITYGLGFRDVHDTFSSSDFLIVNPPSDQDRLYSAFVQDEFALIPDRVKLTFGSKFEHNSDTGFEYEPSGRLSWTPTEKQTFWAAVSRAVRTPSRIDFDSIVNLEVIPPMPPLSPVPVLISSLGNPQLQSEDLLAYELGYRIEITRRLSFDAAAFYNDYDNLIAATSVTRSFVPVPVPHALVASTDVNAGAGHTYGVEASARWDATDHWHLAASYSWMQFHTDFFSPALQGGPKHQVQLTSALDLPANFELNGDVGFVDQYDAPYGLGLMNIPSYVRLDLGVVWHATKNLELGVWGINLAQGSHVEFTSYKTTLVTEIPRGIVGRVTWHF